MSDREQPDGIRYDASTGSWVARHTVMSAARSQEEAKQALASAIYLTAAHWPNSRVAEIVAENAALRAERDRFKEIGQGYERDMRLYFDQSCRNLKRAEAAESRLAALEAERDEALMRAAECQALWVQDPRVVVLQERLAAVEEALSSLEQDVRAKLPRGDGRWEAVCDEVCRRLADELAALRARLTSEPPAQRTP